MLLTFKQKVKDLDWFEQLTGFKESNYEETQSKLVFEESVLDCPVSGNRFELGQFEMPSLHELRERVKALHVHDQVATERLRSKPRAVRADAYALHSMPEANNAVIQVASQFNLLEMASPSVSPEHGVTRYQHDNTQGPACAMAAGAATIFLNYGILIQGKQGQISLRIS